MSFNEWFQTFIEEKELTDVVFEFETKSGYNYFPIGIIQEYLSSCDKEIQNKVKTGLTKAEFCNMNVLEYLEHIAKAIGE